jgi:hypothetical protein
MVHDFGLLRMLTMGSSTHAAPGAPPFCALLMACSRACAQASMAHVSLLFTMSLRSLHSVHRRRTQGGWCHLAARTQLIMRACAAWGPPWNRLVTLLYTTATSTPTPTQMNAGMPPPAHHMHTHLPDQRAGNKTHAHASPLGMLVVRSQDMLT